MSRFSASVFDVSHLFALVAACPARWSVESCDDSLDFSYSGEPLFTISAASGYYLDTLLDVAALDDLSTLSVFPAGCSCGPCGCACVDCEGGEIDCGLCDSDGFLVGVCDDYECTGLSVPCNNCDFYAEPFVYSGIEIEGEPYTYHCYDMSDALAFARRVCVGVSYEVAPLIGELLLDAFRSNITATYGAGKWVGLWRGDDGEAVCFERGAFSVDLADLSRVSFVGGSGAYALEFDSAADLMDADTLAAFVEWVTGSAWSVCPLAVMHRVAA